MSCVSYFECAILPKFCHKLRDFRHLISSLVRGKFQKSQGRQVQGEVILVRAVRDNVTE